VIPRRLHLRNFLSYRECTVDFTGLHLAVLSGRNGDGKSALLDAMTWALWGKARGSLDDAIYQGADEMLVELEFEVEHDVFAVLRKRSRGKSSSVTVYQVDENGMRTTRTGGVARQTQEELNRLLRMDFDTFVNSAFIAQGRSDEFTRKGPTDRKEIFRKVLGLERYQEYADEARNRHRDSQRDLTQVRKANEESDADIRRLPEVVTLLERATEERAAVEVSVSSLEGEVAELQQAVGQFQMLRAEAEASQKRAAEARAAADASQRRVAHLETTLTAARDLLANSETVEAAYRRQQLLRGESDAWNTRLRESAVIREGLNLSRSRVEAEAARLQAELGHVDEQIAVMKANSAAFADLMKRDERLADESRSVKQNLERAQQREAAAALAGRHEAEAATQMKHARDEAQAIKDREGQLRDSTLCPVCRRTLTPGDMHSVEAEYAAERKRLGDIYHAAKAREEDARTSALVASQEATALRKAATARELSLDTEQIVVSGKLAIAKEAAQTLPTFLLRRTELGDLVASQAFALPERAAILTATEQLEGCAYDEAAHSSVRDELKALSGIDQRFMQLTEARQRVESSEEALAHETESLAKSMEQAIGTMAAFVAARGALEATDDVGPRLEASSQSLTAARATSTALVQLVGGLENERSRLITMSARLAAQRDVEKGLAEEADIHGALAEGFGPAGVQAMLIDQSSPLLETYANEMLDRMTGGRIHLQFATSKQLKDGRSVETLDIRISDEMGTKDYEMYSGGERFRVDFAIRIALARLLADRAGAPLPTLIIDEGFGTQDQEGIDRLVEALSVIKDDFRLILLVTHIEELKERFNQRIEVSKDPVAGSIAVVV